MICRLLVCLVLIFVVAFNVGCSTGPDDNVDSPEERAQPEALEDGSYPCEVSNTTRENGPYSLTCEKSGDSVEIQFDNGGFITVDIESQETADGHAWEITGTDARNGDSWEMTVEN